MSGAARFHRDATIAWVVAIVPTVLFWRESIFWLAFMSLWANVVGHWSAFQAARAEDAAGGDMRVELPNTSGVYKCDWCRRNLSAEKFPHLTLVVGERSGWVREGGSLMGWRFWRMLKPQRLHFCEAVCAAQFFEAVGAPDAVGAAEYVS